MPIAKPGIIGILTTAIGIILLGITFNIAFTVFNVYFPFQMQGELTSAMNQLLGAAIQAMFLGIMGWIGSILLLRGVDFLKVEKGVGLVTLKVDKGVGIITVPEELKPEPAKKGQ